MCESICYTLAEPLDDDVKIAIQRTIDAEAQRYNWWVERVYVCDFDGELCGSTKLFLTGYTGRDGDFREVEPLDNALMAWRDSRKILAILAQLAREYGVSWEIEFDDDYLGMIAGNEEDREVIERVDSFLCGADPDDPGLEDRIARIDRQYADRYPT